MCKINGIALYFFLLLLFLLFLYCHMPRDITCNVVYHRHMDYEI